MRTTAFETKRAALRKRTISEEKRHRQEAVVVDRASSLEAARYGAQPAKPVNFPVTWTDRPAFGFGFKTAWVGPLPTVSTL